MKTFNSLIIATLIIIGLSAFMKSEDTLRINSLNTPTSSPEITLEATKYFYGDSLKIRLNEVKENENLKIYLNNQPIKLPETTTNLEVMIFLNHIGTNTIKITEGKTTKIIKTFEVATPAFVCTPINFKLKKNQFNIFNYAADGVPTNQIQFTVENAEFENNSGILKIKPLKDSKKVAITAKLNDALLFHKEIIVE